MRAPMQPHTMNAALEGYGAQPIGTNLLSAGDPAWTLTPNPEIDDINLFQLKTNSLL